MSPIRQTHMNREDRRSAKEQLDWLNLRLARAEENKHLITRIQNQIEIDKEGENALNKARKLIGEIQVPSEILSDKALELTRPTLPNKQSIYHLEQFHEDLEVNIDYAQIHLEAAKNILQDKITPTALVNEAKAKVIDGSSKIKDYKKFSQESKGFLSLQQRFLLGDQQEEK